MLDSLRNFPRALGCSALCFLIFTAPALRETDSQAFSNEYATPLPALYPFDRKPVVLHMSSRRAGLFGGWGRREFEMVAHDDDQPGSVRPRPQNRPEVLFQWKWLTAAEMASVGVCI